MDTLDYLERHGAVNHESVARDRIDHRTQTVTVADLTGWEYETEIIDPNRPVIRRSPKGRKGLPSTGAKMVRSASHVMQKNYGRKQLGFCTATLPNNPEYLPVWAERWGEVTRKFLQEVKRELVRVGAPPEIIGVTEIQMKRSKAIGYPIPHLHFCYVSWDGKKTPNQPGKRAKKFKPDFYISHGTIKEIWDRILTNEVVAVLELPRENVEVDARIELKAVKKSAEGYLGKYMSKGAKDVKQFTDEDPNRTDLPSHWWHCTNELRDKVKGLITRVSPAMVEVITTNFGELINSGAVQYIRAITKNINGVERVLGYAGRWKPDFNPITQAEIEAAFSTS